MLEIDWGKNNTFSNHSRLFLRGDVRPAEYYYADEHNETKPAYVRDLRSVLKRLALMGYTRQSTRAMYEHHVRNIPDYYEEPVLSFDQLSNVLRHINVDRVRPLEDDYDLGELAAAILNDPEIRKAEPSLNMLKSDDGTFFENLDPYIVLCMLGENDANLDRDVVWRYHDIVEGGWIRESDIYEGLQDTDRYLVVTEGSSDSSILGHTLPLIKPEVSDFFQFIDMAENYPFTGVGNLFRFCQGLASIKIQNKVLVVLDNDTTGRDAHRRITSLPLPENVRVAILPYLDAMARVKTLGPAGESVEDVNGRAVAIECFLDLAFGPEKPPTIRWTAYDTSAKDYQGELLNKADYTRAFFANFKNVGYDLGKLNYLWDHLLSCCAGAS